jgi:mRNA interferase MazF
VQRGEVWWAELPPPIGRRPVVLLSRNAAYRLRTSIAIAIITRTVRNIPIEVPLGQEDGMPVTCVINLDDILTIPKSALVERISMLSADKMAAVRESIIFTLDLGI